MNALAIATTQAQAQTQSQAPLPGPPAPDEATPPLRLADAAPQVEVVSSVAALRAVRDEWDALVSATDASPGFAWDATRIWWALCGDDAEARVFTARVADRLVAVLPFSIERRRLGPLTLRVARPMGALAFASACALPVEPGVQSAIAHDVLDRLFIDDRCDAVAFGALDADAYRAWRAAADDTPHVETLRDRDAGIRTTLALPATYDAWIEGIPARAQREVRKRFRRLARIDEPRSIIARHPDSVREDLDELVSLHEQQWHDHGGGVFRARSLAVPYYRALFRAASRHGFARLHRFEADDRVLARHAVLLHGKIAHLIVSARACGPGLDRFGVGNLGLAALVRTMIEDGAEMLDLGPAHHAGAHAHIESLGGCSTPLRQLLITSRRPSVRTRATTFLAASDALDTGATLWDDHIVSRWPNHAPTARRWVESAKLVG